MYPEKWQRQMVDEILWTIDARLGEVLRRLDDLADRLDDLEGRLDALVASVDRDDPVGPEASALGPPPPYDGLNEED
jgi:hypothetical protein